MFLSYNLKKGKEYATVFTSKRIGQEVTKEFTYLGRVLDKEAGIYSSRARGVFTYDLATNEYGPPPPTFTAPSVIIPREQYILDFGDAYALNHFIQTSDLKLGIDSIVSGNTDTLYSMLSFYILTTLSNKNAKDWWEGSYTRILYPEAHLESQRISEFLDEIGDESAQRRFNSHYLPLFGDSKGFTNVLIDSSGLPNSIRFPLAAISNHNGKINRETRLIYVTQQETGMPLFHRYCPGNVIDVTTLIRTIRELRVSGIKLGNVILDAGYYSDSNLKELYDENISFVTRLKENKKIYKELLSMHIGDLDSKSAQHLVTYNGRYVYIKRVRCQLIDGYTGYAFIGLDIGRRNDEADKLFKRATAEKMPLNEVVERMNKQGIFILVSSARLKTSEILPIYYLRQQIEQVFDICKNYANVMPLRVHHENTFRGHLFMTFISAIIIKRLQDLLKESVYNPISLFLNLSNQKCKVYPDRIITHEPVKKVNDCYKLLGITCPEEIPR